MFNANIPMPFVVPVLPPIDPTNAATLLLLPHGCGMLSSLEDTLKTNGMTLATARCPILWEDDFDAAPFHHQPNRVLLLDDIDLLPTYLMARMAEFLQTRLSAWEACKDAEGEHQDLLSWHTIVSFNQDPRTSAHALRNDFNDILALLRKMAHQTF